MILKLFGIQDPGIYLAYIFCFLATLICVVYGIINWNRGSLDITEEDRSWEVEEEKIEKEFE